MQDERLATNAGSPKIPGLASCVRADLDLLLRNENSTTRRISALLTNRGLHALLLYRLSHWLWKARVPLLPLILSRVAQHLFAVDIDVAAELGPGIVIYHGFGLVIGRGARIEGGCHLFHGVTLGNRGSEWVGSDEPDGQPCLEYNVVVGAGAKILGPVRVGQNSMVGANAVVLKDVPEFAIVAGVPARVVGKRRPMDAKFRRSH
jgi:serine O-acetyltransferase